MKAVIIGAGSAFGGQLSIDILSREPLRDAVIGLCDIDAKKLERVRAYVQSAIDHHKLRAKLVVSTDRTEVLPDADFVVTSIAVGGPAYHGQVYDFEIDIPAKYGIRQPVGDTVGPGGIFRGLRTAPVMIEIMRDVARLAPNALVLNYTNPMAILTWAMNAVTHVPVVGLCHGVQGTSKLLARTIGVPYEEISYWVAGINHMAWFLKFRHNGEDAYPRLRKALEHPEQWEPKERGEHHVGENTRIELMRRFGYFCTESSMHCAEYFPYFQNDTELMGSFPDLRQAVKSARQHWYEDMGVKASQAGSVELIRSHEYASAIMEAMLTDVPFRFNGNVMNGDLISNLPRGCCVEVPCLTDREGVHPCRIGDLPEVCAALCRTNVNPQALTVKAILDRNPESAFHALLLDPVTARTCSMDQARQMFDEMWRAESELLSYYKK